MRISVSLIALACLSLLGAERAMAGPPFPKAGLKFDEKSPYAMLIFEVEPQTRLKSWNLEVLAYSLDTQTWTYGPLKGWARFRDIEPKAGDRLLVGLVKPAGTYAVNNISSQGFWRACFNGGTMAFTLEAGKVNYIGLIDPNAALEQIQRDLPHETKGPVALYDTPRLQLTPPSQRPDWNATVTQYLAARLPKVSAPVVAQEPVAMTFAPGHSAIAGKICQKY